MLQSFSGIGLMIGTLFFAASLTPSLVPRSPVIQGLLGGFCLVAGYGTGVFLRSLWLWLELPVFEGRVRAFGNGLAILACTGAGALALWWASGWQNRLRALMDMQPVDGGGSLFIAGLAFGLFLVLLLIGRLIRFTAQSLTFRLGRLVPGPQAALFGIALTAALFWMIGNGVLAASALRLLDASYQKLNALFEEASPQPTEAYMTGGPGSLVAWLGLGRAGREFVSSGPNAMRISELSGLTAREPLRVYVGLNSAENPVARAELALAELIRIGAFDRANLVIVTPTGTGWVDPESQTALEHVLRGDVATVSVQYSYLASWIALLTEPAYGAETARAVFAAVYGHWTRLPSESRPRLFLHGLSLGAYNSDLSHDLHQVIADPYAGALWAGPPFASQTWRNITANRNAGSPAWLPRFRDGSVIRFTAQQNHLGDSHKPWGPYRIIFLQYASDAIVFYDPRSLWRRPAWMAQPMGPDVSPDFVWIPIVTFLQLTFDVMLATLPPKGHGHVYAFPHYVDAWASLTDAPGWTAQGLERLKRSGP
ncbi:MAG: alpha/beta-hydrolase family protein [Methylobacterium sp.]|nr:alpha/beta-hydrolase family protein [Methylobacterium sp.]